MSSPNSIFASLVRLSRMMASLYSSWRSYRICSQWQHPAEFSPDSLWRALFYYAMFVALEFTAAVIAFLLEPKENKRLLVWLFWQRFFYRQLMYYVAIKSTLASLRGVAVGWQKLERKATVKA